MTNLQNLSQRARMVAALTNAYRDLFQLDTFAVVASKTTHEALAERINDGIFDGSANWDGEGVKRACKALGIKQTRKAIVAFLTVSGE